MVVGQSEINLEGTAIRKGMAAAVTALLLGGCLWGGSWVASIDPQHPSVREASWPGVELAGAPIEAVLPTQLCGDYFLADVILDGRGPFLLMLDTGYPQTQLSTRTAQELSGSRRLHSIEVGPLQVEGSIPFGVQDLDAVGWALGRQIDGILGYTVFGDLVQTYDFPESQVRVSEAHISGAGHWLFRSAPVSGR